MERAKPNWMAKKYRISSILINLCLLGLFISCDSDQERVKLDENNEQFRSFIDSVISAPKVVELDSAANDVVNFPIFVSFPKKGKLTEPSFSSIHSTINNDRYLVRNHPAEWFDLVDVFDII